MIFPPKLAQQWIAAWNQRDLNGLLSLYADGIELRSPFAKVFAHNGVVRNKEELRTYWAEVIRRMPNVRLELIGVYSGHQAMTLHYLDDSGRNVMETMWFNDQDLISFEAACIDKPR